MQAELCGLYELTDEGYVCKADVTAMLLALMQRLGYWLRFDFRPPPADLSLHDVADADADGWHRVRGDVVRHLLDGTHAVLSLHRMLLHAELSQRTWTWSFIRCIQRRPWTHGGNFLLWRTVLSAASRSTNTSSSIYSTLSHR